MIEPATQQANQQLINTLTRWDTRLRLSQLALWVPRGAAIGLLIGLLAALISWLRPWLLGPQILSVSIATTLLGMIIAGVLVMVWPRSTMDKARYFDQRFGLKERSSTAIELVEGKIAAPGQFRQLQVADALARTRSVDAGRYIRVQWRRNELIGLAVMIALLALSIVASNPQSNVLTRQAAVNAAIQQQINQLDQLKQNIQNNSALTDAEKAQLNKIIQDAIAQLQQPNITQAEAVAALANAQQQLNNAQTKLTPEQKAAAQEAGSALNGTQATEGAGQALQKGDLKGASDQLKNLADKVGAGQMTPSQMNDTANALENAAKNLQSVNPAAADALRRAADALRKGDTAAAQKALQEAADALKNQQSDMQNTAMSQAASNASNQAGQSQQQVAQSGRQGQPGQQGQQSQQGQAGQQGQQQSQQGQNQQAGQQGQQGQQAGQQGQQQQGQQGQTGQQGQQAGQQGQGQQGQTGQQGQQAGQQGQGQQQGQQAGSQSGQSGGPQQGQNGSQSQQGSQTGDQAGNGQQGSQGGDPNSSSGQPGQNSSQGQPGGQEAQQGAGAGQGQGGAGMDTTSGQSDPNNSSPANNGNGDGSVVPYEKVFAPTFIGGNGGTELSPNGTGANGASDPGQSGDFSNNPTGNATVSLSSVAGQAAAQADRAMDADHIPGALRGVVRDYFTGLQGPQ